jgi:4-nitrophenyl phosphatase
VRQSAGATRLVEAGWLDELAGIVLDMDGVLYRGNALIPEVPAFLAALDAAGIRYAMATNNATLGPRQYVAKLAGMGIDVPEASIVTSSVATATYLRARFPAGTRVYVVGMAALEEAIYADGYFARAERDAEVVVSGADFELTYAKLRTACLAIRAGAQYVATNADATFPAEDGLVPGSGAIVAALRTATSVDPVVVGKPNPALVEESLRIMGVPAARAAMLGDRLDTDILSGQRANVRTILVLTGVSTVAEVAETGITPNLTVDTLQPLTERFLTRVHTARA